MTAEQLHYIAFLAVLSLAVGLGAAIILGGAS